MWVWGGVDLFCILKFPSSLVLFHVTSTGWGLSWGPREGIFHSLFLRSPKVSLVTRWIAQEGRASRRQYGEECLTQSSWLLIMFIVYFHSSPLPTRMKTTIRLRFSPVFFTNVSPEIDHCLRLHEHPMYICWFSYSVNKKTGRDC